MIPDHQKGEIIVKKKLFKLLAMALCVVMALSLTLPAFALEDLSPPLWQQFGYSSMEKMLTDWEMTEEEYAAMVADELEYEESLRVEESERLAWLEAHADEAAAFDPYAFYEEEFGADYPAEEYIADAGFTAEQFREDMLAVWMDARMYEEEQAQVLADFIAAHPREYAAFDPYRYCVDNLYYESAQEYMDLWKMTPEEFEREMLEYWMWEIQSQESQLEYVAQEKEIRGGSRDGVNVMVDGLCIPFPDARPEITNDRTMVPLAAAMEYLGAEVSYRQDEHAAAISMPEKSFYLYHKIGSAELIITDAQPGGSEPEDMVIQTVRMDVPSYIKEGRTMVPVAFFAQALGYEVFWDDAYKTAVLLDRDAAIARIDEQFTLVNRILYALSGDSLVKDGQSIRSDLDMKLSLTLLDSMNGDEKFDVTMSADILSNDVAAEGTYEMDMQELFDLVLDISNEISELTEEEQALYDQYQALLSKMTFELIVSMEDSRLYMRSPLFSAMELVESDDTWVSVAFGDFIADEDFTLGTLAITYAFMDVTSPFRAWDEAVVGLTDLLDVVGDDCFTKSGSTYSIQWSEEDEYMSGSAQLKITPVGERDCRFSLTFDLNSDEFTVDADLSGASGKLDADLDVHVKNLLKLVLDVTGRMTATSKQPASAPPAGDDIFYADDLSHAALGW